MPQWCPKNYEAGSAAGPSTLRFGIEHSRNLMTVRLSRDMGMPIIAEYARRFGVYDNLMPALSMALGAGETTLLRMVTGLFDDRQRRQADQGRPSSIASRTATAGPSGATTSATASLARRESGPVRRSRKLVDDRKQIIDPMSAFQMTSMSWKASSSAAPRRSSRCLNRPIAGKTGTTNDYKDAWFIGFTPDLVVGVYIGFDQPSSLGHGETGGNVAAPVVRDFMREALADVPPVPFRAPPGIKLVRVNHKTGLPAGPGDKTAILEAFKPGEEPAGSDRRGAGYRGRLERCRRARAAPPMPARRLTPIGAGPDLAPAEAGPGAAAAAGNALTAGPGGLY